MMVEIMLMTLCKEINLEPALINLQSHYTVLVLYFTFDKKTHIFLSNQQKKSFCFKYL